MVRGTTDLGIIDCYLPKVRIAASCIFRVRDTRWRNATYAARS